MRVSVPVSSMSRLQHSLGKGWVEDERIIHAAQPYVVRDDECKAARLNHIRTPQRKPDEREEDHGGQRDTEQGGREWGVGGGRVRLEVSALISQ